MSNIIASDFYRVRKGAAVRNTFLGIVLITILVLALGVFVESGTMETLVVEANGSAQEITEIQQDIEELNRETAVLTTGASLAEEMLAQAFVIFFFLPVAIAVFCADFTASTHRNTLSYESDRGKVYWAKLALSLGISLVLVFSLVALNWVLGGIILGFDGFSLAYFGRILITFLLQLPVYLAVVAVLHLMIAFTKKSSSTIAIFLVGYFTLLIVLQVITSYFPGLEWMILLDPLNAARIMAYREGVPMATMAFIAGYNLVVAAVATLLGLFCFKKADMP